MHNLLIICGPTATGKTRLALDFARKLNGDVISADSRQVYKYMDIVTGKDVPGNFKIQNSKFKIHFYTDGQIKIWGYDLVNPDQEFSVSLYRDFAHKIIGHVYKEERLPIVVGGAGLFIKSITEDLSKINIPPNPRLRQKYAHLSAAKLLQILEEKNPTKALSLNESDRGNPRRLIRLLEINEHERSGKVSVSKSARVIFDNILQIGLMVSDWEAHKKIIGKRVDERVKNLDTEIEFLRTEDLLKYAPRDTIGYKEWIGYLEGGYSREEAIAAWKRSENLYAKRQMTWFRKQSGIQWFDVLDKDYENKVEKLVRNWHNSLEGS